MATKKVEIDERIISIQAEMDKKVEEIHQTEQEQAELQALLNARVQQLKDSFQGKFNTLNSRKEYLITELKVLFEQVPQKVTKTQRKVSLLSGDVVVKNATTKLDYDKKTLLENAETAINTYYSTKEELKNKLSDIEDRIDEASKLDPLDVDLDILYVQKNELLEAIGCLHCEWLKFVKSNEVKDFDWSAYKENLEIVEVDVIDEETGEVKGKVNQIINTETGEVVETDGLSVMPVAEQVVIK